MERIKLCKTFKFLSASLDKVINKKLKTKDLSITQGVVLLWLSEQADQVLTLKELEKKFGTAQSTTFGVVNRLEQKGLVTTYMGDHRTKYVKLNPEGEALLGTIRTYIQETDQLVFQGFSQGEILLFLELLQRAERNLLQQQGIKAEEYYE